MSEQAAQEEIRDAAAVGAAAAVDAIVGEQDEQAREEAVTNAALQAEQATEQAEQEAQAASEAATEAATLASEARANADLAEATAQEAAAEAGQASAGVNDLREFITAGFRELREFVTSSLAPEPPSEEPTEVIVTHGNTGQSTGQGPDTGSGESATGNERPYRHRFGHRR